MPGDVKALVANMGGHQLYFPRPSLPEIDSEYEVTTYAKSPHNDEVSLRNRVLQVTLPQPMRGTAAYVHFTAVAAMVKSTILGAMAPTKRWSLYRSYRHEALRHGNKTYLPAYISLTKGEEPLTKADSRIKCFLKMEKASREKDSTRKAPRAIQYRGPRYNLMIGRYLFPFEESFYAAFSVLNQTGCHTSKGLNPDARAALLVDLWGQKASPRAICLDYSRFDAHIDTVALRAEHAVYNEMFKDRLLAWLLQMQLRNSGVSQFGSKYRRRGGRMSGDVNTALGNTIINFIVLRAATHGFNTTFVCEGDDAIIFGEAGEIELLQEVLCERMAANGFEIEYQVAERVEQLDYCSSKPIEVSPGNFRSARNWPKPLVSDWSSIHLLPREVIPARARTTAVCYSLLYSGLPVYSAIAEYMLSHSPLIGPATMHPHELKELWNKYSKPWMKHAIDQSTGMSAVTPTARDSFFAAFDISPQHQVSIESSLQQQQGPHPVAVQPQELKALRALL